MNTFASKYDTKYVSEPNILTLTETELDNFINFNKEYDVPFALSGAFENSHKIDKIG